MKKITPKRIPWAILAIQSIGAAIGILIVSMILGFPSAETWRVVLIGLQGRSLFETLKNAESVQERIVLISLFSVGLLGIFIGFNTFEGASQVSVYRGFLGTVFIVALVTAIWALEPRINRIFTQKP